MSHYIVKYQNRKLYNKNTKRYVSLNELGTFVKDGVPFVVKNFTTKEDITHDTLVKILAQQLNNSEIKSTTKLVNLIQNL